MRERTLGLVGLGRLGQWVARVALAFEMEVLAWRSGSPVRVVEP